MVDHVLLLLLALMTLLLVVFLYAVITLPPKDAVRTEPPVLTLPAPPPHPEASLRLPSPAGPAAAARRPRHTAGPAGHVQAPTPAPSGVPRRQVSGRPPWEPAPRPPQPRR